MGGIAGGDVALYLQKNWCHKNRFHLSGRRHISCGIPLSRTTMPVEAHWSMLKRTFLLRKIRPRCDTLVFIIQKKLLPKVEADLQDILSGILKPSWWSRFICEWKRSIRAPINGSYSKDKPGWVCSCDAFINNKFIICKYVVNCTSTPVVYREVPRMGNIPFLSFEFCENRRFPDFNGEYILAPAATLPTTSVKL